MTIEVISRKHPAAAKITVCRNCGAELKYTKADTWKHKTTDYTGSVDIYNVIRCPDCWSLIYV
jgi:DNA-directed RNA polymerase subunit RPC12/RpoP